MAETFPKISFAGQGDWQPRSGGHGYLDFDGAVKVSIDSMSLAKSKDGTKSMFVVGMTCQDEDCAGTPLMTRVIYHGFDNKQQNMVYQFNSMLHSTGTSLEKIQQFGRENAEMDPADAIKQLIGREGYVEIGHRMYDGEETTDVTGWIAADRYAKMVEAGTHRRKPRIKGAKSTSSGTVEVPADIGGAAAAPPPAAGNAAGYAREL